MMTKMRPPMPVPLTEKTVGHHGELGAADKGYARTAVRLQVARAVWALWDEVRRTGGVDQNWLVTRLGSNKGRVSRLLNNPGNWTLDTVADLIEAMESRIVAIEIRPYRAIDAAARVEPSPAGMRRHPMMWNMIDMTCAAEKDGDAAALERPTADFASLVVAPPRVVAQESE